MKTAMMIGGVAILLWLLVTLQHEEPKVPIAAESAQDREALKATVCADTDGVLAKMIQAKFIAKTKNDWKDVYITKFWYGMDIDSKTGLARTIATCKTDGSVRFYDNLSGKQVAKYDPLFHFSMD